MVTCALGFPSGVPLASIALTTSWPLSTSPNTTCFPSRCGHSATVTKNWDPFVFGPALAMESRNGRSWSIPNASSSNFSP